MSTSDFPSNLRQIAEDGRKRLQLLREHAEELGGSPDYVPAHWYEISHPAYWMDELERRYFNMADYYGWPELPSYEPKARQWVR